MAVARDKIALVVSAPLNRTSSEATNMAAEMRQMNSVENLIVTMPDERRVTTNEGIYEAFWSFLHKLHRGIRTAFVSVRHLLS